jgi:hypothetical protein
MSYEGELRVWWVTNPPRKPRYYPVSSPEAAAKLLDEIAQKELKDRWIISNAGGLEVFEDGEWIDWMDKDGNDIDQWSDMKEEEQRKDEKRGLYPQHEDVAN